MTLDTILWLAGFVAEAAVVALLVNRLVFRKFPIFSSYLACSLLSDVVLLTTAHYYAASYLNVYLLVLVIDSLFQFGVLVELAWSVLRPARAILPRWTMPAIAVLIALTGAAVWPLVSGPGVSSFSLAGRLIFHVQETVSILRIMVFLLLAGCSQLLSIGWRDRELQIATGLGFYSLVSLAVWIHHTSLTSGPKFHLLDQMTAVSYVCSLGYWVVCFATKEAERREFTPQMQNLLLAMAGTAKSTRIALANSASSNARNGRDS